MAGDRARESQIIQRSKLLQHASRAARDAAAERASFARERAEAVLVEIGDPQEHVFLLGRGRVRLEQGDLIVAYRGAGDVVNEALFVSTEPATERVVAAEPTDLLRLPAAFLRALFTSDADFAKGALAVIGAARAELEARIASLVGLEIAPRLCRFLLAYAERWGVPSPHGTLLAATLTHLEIARAIGSTRETVTLTIGALRREGLLNLQGRRLVLVDRDALLARSS